MAKDIAIHYDPIGNTLNMWWGEPDHGSLSEEAEHSDDVMIVNSKGQVIGLEKLNFFPKEMDPVKYIQGDIKKKLDLFFRSEDGRKLLGKKGIKA